MTGPIVETPELRRLYGVAVQLARPLARGWITPEGARAALMQAARTAARASGGGPFALWRGAHHVLKLRLEIEVQHRDRVQHAIDRAVRPLLGAAPSNALLAAAHDANGAADFPLTEAEVTALVRSQVFWWRRQSRRRLHAA